jgi:hypothetical protein
MADHPGIEQGSPNSCIYSGSVLSIWCYLSHSRISGSRNHEVEVQWYLLWVTIHTPWSVCKIFASCSCDSILYWPRGLSPKGGTFPPEETTMIWLNWKLRLLPLQFEFLNPLSQQRKQLQNWLGWFTLNTKRETILLLSNVWNTREL